MGDTAGPYEHTACPRCGYDQRGIIDTWRECCDVYGRCAECGLSYEWSDVLDPTRRIPEWFVEDIEQQCRPMMVVQTIGRVFWPWHFWRRISMSHPVCGRRIAVLLVFVLLGAIVLTSAGAAVRPLQVWMQETTLSGSNVTGMYVYIHAFVAPWSQNSPGQYTSGLWGTAGIDPPARLVGDIWLGSLGLGLYASIALVIGAAAFLLLPQTRRTYKVRLVHAGRAAAYGLCWTWLIVALVPWVAQGHQFIATSFWFHDSLALANISLTLCAVALQIIWWWCAIARYMKLPHAPFVAVAVVIIGWLTLPTLVVVVAEFIVPALG